MATTPGNAINITSAGVVFYDGSTNVFEPIVPGLATTVLTSNGVSSAPTFQAAGGSGFTSIAIQKITTTGTYTPTAGTKYCIVECVGGGGGGGTAANTRNGGGGGGAGSYSRSILTVAAATGQTVTIGTGGGAASAGNPTTFGSLVTTNGGGAGTSWADPNENFWSGGDGGAIGTGDISFQGENGSFGFFQWQINGASSGAISGAGASSFYGSGAKSVGVNNGGSSSPSNATAYGSGGAGGVSGGGGTANGSSGSDGVCVITEFIS